MILAAGERQYIGRFGEHLAWHAACTSEAVLDQENGMKRDNRDKLKKEDSVNEAPSQPDGVRRPSEGGVGQEYSRRPPVGDHSPTSKTP